MLSAGQEGRFQAVEREANTHISQLSKSVRVKMHYIFQFVSTRTLGCIGFAGLGYNIGGIVVES